LETIYNLIYATIVDDGEDSRTGGVAEHARISKR